MRIVREGSGSESGSWTGSEWSGSEGGEEVVKGDGGAGVEDVVMGNGSAEGHGGEVVDKGKGREVAVDGAVAMEVDDVPDTAETVEPATAVVPPDEMAVDTGISPEMADASQLALPPSPAEEVGVQAEDAGTGAGVVES